MELMKKILSDPKKHLEVSKAS